MIPQYTRVSTSFSQFIPGNFTGPSWTDDLPNANASQLLAMACAAVVVLAALEFLHINLLAPPLLDNFGNDLDVLQRGSSYANAVSAVIEQDPVEFDLVAGRQVSKIHIQLIALANAILA